MASLECTSGEYASLDEDERKNKCCRDKGFCHASALRTMDCVINGESTEPKACAGKGSSSEVIIKAMSDCANAQCYAKLTPGWDPSLLTTQYGRKLCLFPIAKLKWNHIVLFHTFLRDGKN
jgi:hypothetical protein